MTFDPVNGPRHPLLPDLSDLRTFTPATFRADLAAGLTVAIFAVPQVIAYALLAGVPPAHGIFAALTMSAVAALWGSSRFLNTGPTNTAALLAAAALLPFQHDPRLLAIMFTLTLLVGLLRLAAGLLRLGVLVEFVPDSAFLGFTAAAGLLIATGQIHHLLDVPPPHAPWLPMRLATLCAQVPDANPGTLAIGLAVAAALYATHRYTHRFPVALVILTLATLAADGFAAARTIPRVGDIVPLPQTLPAFTWPCFDPALAHALFPAALAIAIVGLIEAVSIGQSLALRHREAIDFNREFVGQGLSHVVAAFFQGLPGSGSFSRSLLIERTGARTRWAHVYLSLAMFAILLLTPRLLNRIPVCALAGMLLYIGIKLVDVRRLLRVCRTTWSDAAVLALTALTTLLFRIEYGIFAGVLAAACLHLQRTRALHLDELVPAPGGGFTEVPYDGPAAAHPAGAVVAVSLGGDLFYGIAHELRRALQDVATRQRPRHLVIRLRRAYTVDYSCWSALLDFAESFQSGGGNLYLCGVPPDFSRFTGGRHARAIIDPARVYPADPQILRGFERCLADLFSSLPANTPLAPAWAAYRPPSN